MRSHLASVVFEIVDRLAHLRVGIAPSLTHFEDDRRPELVASAPDLIRGS